MTIPAVSAPPASPGARRFHAVAGQPGAGVVLPSQEGTDVYQPGDGGSNRG